jgi:hypothetical protein
MAHPDGGRGNGFYPKHSFDQAYAFVGTKGVEFRSTTGELIHARQGATRDGATPTNVFEGERSTHGSACIACWGFRVACSGSRIDQCAEALDGVIP